MPKRFKVGDKVVLLKDETVYAPLHNLLVRKGTVGTVKAAGVPCVTMSRHRPHPETFNCVDFPASTELVNWQGKPTQPDYPQTYDCDLKHFKEPKI